MMINKPLNNQKAVPESKVKLGQLKHEIASEIGVNVPPSGYYGDMTSRQCGSISGYMVKRFINMAEDQLIGRN